MPVFKKKPKENSTQSIVAWLKIADYIIMKLVNGIFKVFQWRMRRFLRNANSHDRRILWQHLVKSHFLIKTKIIMSYQDVKHEIENDELCAQAGEIANQGEWCPAADSTKPSDS